MELDAADRAGVHKQLGLHVVDWEAVVHDFRDDLLDDTQLIWPDACRIASLYGHCEQLVSCRLGDRNDAGMRDAPLNRDGEELVHDFGSSAQRLDVGLLLDLERQHGRADKDAGVHRPVYEFFE